MLDQDLYFCRFLLRHFGHWKISVICLTVVLKLTITLFFSMYFLTFWPKWLNFFWSFQKRFSLWLKNDKKNSSDETSGCIWNKVSNFSKGHLILTKNACYYKCITISNSHGNRPSWKLVIIHWHTIDIKQSILSAVEYQQNCFLCLFRAFQI